MCSSDLDAMKLQRDFARGESPVQKMADGTLVKANPYGTATAGGPGNFKMGEATMKDHMGRTVPMNPYLAEQAKVQASKFGNMPTDRHGNAIENEEDNGEDDEEDDEEPFVRYDGPDETLKCVNEMYDTWESWEPDTPIGVMLKNAISSRC